MELYCKIKELIKAKKEEKEEVVKVGQATKVEGVCKGNQSIRTQYKNNKLLKKSQIVKMRNESSQLACHLIMDLVSNH
jgi:hypothetical protein